MRKVCEYLVICAVILLQIVKVSPGTHPVKNHESECRTNESQFKKTTPKLKLLGPLQLCETSLVQFTEIKI